MNDLTKEKTAIQQVRESVLELYDLARKARELGRHARRYPGRDSEHIIAHETLFAFVALLGAAVFEVDERLARLETDGK